MCRIELKMIRSGKCSLGNISGRAFGNNELVHTFGFHTMNQKIENMKNLFAILLFGMAIVLIACEDEEADEVGGQSSATTTSHNTGKNCMGCHQFTAAGSVYNKALTSASAGAIVKLTSQANGAGTVLGTFTVNKSGSFYTSSSINFGSGVYVNVTGSSGSLKHMASAITSGACNTCHGSSTSKIWTE